MLLLPTIPYFTPAQGVVVIPEWKVDHDGELQYCTVLRYTVKYVPAKQRLPHAGRE